MVTRETPKCISRRFLFRKLRSQLSPPQTPEVGGGGVLNNFIWGGSVRPEVQPLTLLYATVNRTAVVVDSD